jgi:hypothetical protein
MLVRCSKRLVQQQSQQELQPLHAAQQPAGAAPTTVPDVAAGADGTISAGGVGGDAGGTAVVPCANAMLESLEPLMSGDGTTNARET